MSGRPTLPTLSVDLLARIRPDEGGWVVSETEHATILVVSMLFNDRVLVVPKDSPLSSQRYWCYRKGGAAILAALAWDGSDDTEPVGWIKSWDQRYGDI